MSYVARNHNLFLLADATPILADDELLALAVANYNARNAGRRPPISAETEREPFLRRIQRNYLRHECTDYEDVLNAGSADRDALHRQINASIAEAYPHLSEDGDVLFCDDCGDELDDDEARDAEFDGERQCSLCYEQEQEQHAAWRPYCPD